MAAEGDVECAVLDPDREAMGPDCAAKDAYESSLKRKAVDPVPRLRAMHGSDIHFLQGTASQPPALKFTKVNDNGSHCRSSSQPEPESALPEVKRRGQGQPPAPQQQP